MLTDVFVRQCKADPTKDQRFFDQGGLALVVTKAGTKSFRWKYRFGGKEKLLTIGKYPTITLKAAREAVLIAKGQLHDGIDPGAVKQQKKLATKMAVVNTFEACADEWHKERKGQISDETWNKERRLLDVWLYPWIGKRPMDQVEPPELLTVIRRVQQRSVETAHRVLAMVKGIYRLGIVSGRAMRNPAIDLIGMLPTVKNTHHAAVIQPDAFGKLLKKLDSSKASFPVVCALRLLPLLFCRPGELREMRWSEVDLERGEWTYLVTKTQTEHRVPLARQAVAILTELKPLTGHYERVFVARQDGSPLSVNTINAALRAVGIDTKTEHTGHGFRASARTLLAERLQIPPHVIEHQLAHAAPGALGRAYNRTLFIDERRDMMQRWADYCDQLKQG